MKQNKLYILCGIPFSGKSTLANELVRILGYKVVDLDEVKFDLFGKEIKDSEIDKNGWDRVYQEMYKRIDSFLKNGETVICDTGNFTEHERGLVRNIADKLSVTAITVFVDTPKEISLARLLKNRQTKIRFDVDDEDFESSVEEMQKPDETEKHIVYELNTPVDVWIKRNVIDIS